MGAKDSKPSFISYEDATKRVSESELRRIREAFKRCAGPNGASLSLEAFAHNVLSDGVPFEVVEWLYQACGGTKRGITFKDLLCGIVVLTKGNIEEKIRFLWTLYTNTQNDNGTYIYRKEFAHALYVEKTSLPENEIHKNSDTLTSLFGSCEKVTFEQFRSWLLIHKDATVLSKWLLLDRNNATQDLETPTFYQSLAGVTHLDEREIIELEKWFWSLRAAAGGTLCVDGQNGLDNLLAPTLGTAAAAGLALAFDDNCDAQVDFKELCCGLSAACRGPSTERLKFCFKIFDKDKDGVLNKKELIDMVGILCTVANEAIKTQGSRASTPSNEDSDSERGFDPEVILLNLRDKLLTVTKDGRKPVFQLGPTNEEDSSVVFQNSENGETEDEGIISNTMILTTEDFLIWSVESAESLVTPFMELIFEVCHVVLGLRPQCPHQERDIVLGWMRRAGARGVCPGQFWYVVSAEWWARWQRWAASPRSCCRRVFDDDSLATDSTESMGSLLWRAETASMGSAGDSGLGSAGSGARPPHPGPVDTARLLDAAADATVPSLTGEGGELRRGLEPHRDYELVPESLWRTLARWFGAPRPLPRQVVGAAGAPPAVELYPLQLLILRHTHQNNRLAPPERHVAYTATFSRLATVKQVLEFLCGALGLSRERARLWLADGPPLLLDDERRTLAALALPPRARLLLELRNQDLTWPEEITALGANGAGRIAERRETLTAPDLPGATGLHNLGNTCFMNAALQAVWNTAPLTEYFNTGMHLYEVNTSNPLGTKGELALRFGELCKEVWSGSARSVAPVRLRACVSRWARALAGGGQHDAQELLAWLLDALHEDLNRAAPPTVSSAPAPLPAPPPASGTAQRPDQSVASEAWAQWAARNQSVMTELFYGQLKSQVRCGACGHLSVRFDTYNMLSLPLPLDAGVRVDAVVILLDGSVPIKYGVRVTSGSTYFDLKKKLSKLCGLQPECMSLVQLAEAVVARTLPDGATVPAGGTPDLFAYEVPPAGPSPDADADARSHHSACSLLPNHTGVSGFKSAGGVKPSSDAGAAEVSARTSSLCMPALFCFKRSRSEIVMYKYPRMSAGDTWQAARSGSAGAGELQPPRRGLARADSSPAEMGARPVSTPLPPHPHDPHDVNYIFAVHRKQSGAEAWFTPWQRARPSVFGVPLVVGLRRGASGRDLYASVWTQLARLLAAPPSAGAHNHAHDCDDSLGYEFPFRLRVVDGRAAWCALCAWPSLCRGCVLPADDTPLVDAHLAGGENGEVETGLEPDSSSGSVTLAKDAAFFIDRLTGDKANTETVTLTKCGTVRVLRRERLAGALLAIDWDPTALHLRYQAAREKAWVVDRSVAECSAAAARAVDLASCLRAFTSEETLEQRYHCDACRRAQPATKKLQLWRLPPVLIVHLKRFQYVNNKWMKSQKVVNFPRNDFDPTPYLASVPQETILRHQELRTSKRRSSLVDIVDRISESEADTSDDEVSESIEATAVEISKEEGKRKSVEVSARKRLESSSLTTTPVLDDNLVDFHQHHLKPGYDPFDLKYRLFAVVSHSGELHGGHYVCYARAHAGSGAWLCYNDSSCRLVTAPEGGSPYLLFYVRRGLSSAAYLPPQPKAPPPSASAAPDAGPAGCALS